MARATFYFEAFLMVLTIASCMARTQESLDVGEQCRSRGPYAGACLSHNIVNGELNCASLMCADPRQDGGYDASPTGYVINGTPCETDEVCSNGACVRSPVRAPRTQSWTRTVGLVAGNAFPCTSPTVSPRRPSQRRPAQIRLY